MSQTEYSSGDWQYREEGGVLSTSRDKTSGGYPEQADGMKGREWIIDCKAKIAPGSTFRPFELQRQRNTLYVACACALRIVQYKIFFKCAVWNPFKQIL